MQDVAISLGESTQARELAERRIRSLKTRAWRLVPGSAVALAMGVMLLPAHLTGRAQGLPYGLFLVGVLFAGTVPYSLLFLSRVRAALEGQPVAMSATRQAVGRGRGRRTYIVVSGSGREGGVRESAGDNWGQRFDTVRPVLVYYGEGSEPPVVVVDTQALAVTVGKLRRLGVLTSR